MVPLFFRLFLMFSQHYITVGEIVKNLELKTNNYVLWDGRTTSGQVCSDGVYYYALTYKLVNNDVVTKKDLLH